MEAQNVRIVVSDSLQISSKDQIIALLQQPVPKFIQGDPRSLIQIRPPALCTVCYNLDPNEAPQDDDGGKRAWAQSEFNIPPETPVAKVKISKSEELLESAQRGCLTCLMIATSISGVSPGWEKEESFIHFYLAPNLPMVVKLTFGTTISLEMGREAMLELGLVLPEGEERHWEIEMGISESKSAKTLEIEIYRRNLAPEQTTVGGTYLPTPYNADSSY
jgi:hypothetical protein